MLDLFRVSDVRVPIEPLQRARRQTLGHNGVTIFVSEVEAKIVASCMLITAPNLLRSGRSHAFLENRDAPGMSAFRDKADIPEKARRRPLLTQSRRSAAICDAQGSSAIMQLVKYADIAVAV